MVMFHDEIPFAAAQQRGAVQLALLEDLVSDAQTLGDIDLDAAEQLAREKLPLPAPEPMVSPAGAQGSK
jgi:hypothetical protein